MTDEDKLYEAAEAYWLEFSKLVDRALRRVTPELRDELAMRLQEKSNVYGRKTSK